MSRFILLIALLASTLFPGLPAIAGGLNDTGITTCSDATQNGLPCPVAGFPGQDAEYGTNTFNFTKLDASGNALPASATNHTCVLDNVTGLVWEVKTADGGLRDQKWSYTWYDSSAPGGNPGTASGGTCHDTGRCDTEKFTQDVNAAGLCGFHDGVCPTRKNWRVSLITAFPILALLSIRATFRIRHPIGSGHRPRVRMFRVTRGMSSSTTAMSATTSAVVVVPFASRGADKLLFL